MVQGKRCLNLSGNSGQLQAKNTPRPSLDQGWGVEDVQMRWTWKQNKNKNQEEIEKEKDEAMKKDKEEEGEQKKDVE